MRCLLKMSDDPSELLATFVKAVLALAIMAGFLICMHLIERTTRAQIREACPSGTAERVCEQAEAEMSREPFGRACVRFSRWMGGEK